MKRILYMLAIALSLLACREEIDKSNRYTFTGETVADFLLNRSEEYSHFITILKQAEMMSLLNTYGQYTLFLPTNEAVEKFLIEQDSLYWATRDDNVPYETGITSPLLEDLSDSMATVIAKTHLVEARYPMAEMNEGTLQRRNFNLRSLGINYKVVDERFYIMINNQSPIIDGDNLLENGVVHIMGKAISPTSKNLPGVISDYKYFSIFNAAMIETGFQDSLLLDRDEDYVPWDYNAMGYGNTSGELTRQNLETKFYKYTAFIEPDDVFHENGIYTLADLRVFAEKWYGTEERDNPRSPKNALNKFVAYHFVERELAYNEIVFHNFYYTDKFNHPMSIKNSEEVMIAGFDRYDYFETMAGTLMKVTKPLSTTQGADIFINYSKREAPFNQDMRKHINVRIIPPTEFTTIKDEYVNFSNNTLNGIINPIDKILVYNEDEMVGNILNERMRFDIATLLPELSCNKMRYYRPINDYCYYLQANYFKSLRYRALNPLLYLAGTQAYYGDVLSVVDDMDFSIRLPHVPPRTYELRVVLYGHGIVQAYVDDEITGIPFDINTRAEKSGFVPDSETEDNGYDNDKLMRNRGYMKMPATYMLGNIVARDADHARLILTRKYFGEGDHWLRFRKVSDGMSFEADFDFIELVPLNIISDPTKPEDRF